MAASPLPPGTRIAGRYVVERLLGEGGMGAVYQAQQVPLGRTVAVKVIKPGLTDDTLAVKRFIAEAKAVSQMSHPHVVTVHDFGAIDGGDPERAEGGLFIAMEFLDGIDLRDLIAARGHIPYRRAAQLCAEVAEALAHAHERNVIHRDLKPDNIMIVAKTGGEHVKVVDFGVAKLRPDPGQEALTQTGMVVGTPGYIAPEYVSGVTNDKRSDLYALGVVLYEAISGTSPFDAETPVQLVLRHVTEIPSPLDEVRPDLRLPPALTQLVMELLEKDPEDRPRSALEVAQRLRAFSNESAAVLPPLVDQHARAQGRRGDRKTPRGTISAFAAAPRATPNATAALAPASTPPTATVAVDAPPVSTTPVPAKKKRGGGCLALVVVSLGLFVGLIVLPLVFAGVSVADDVAEAMEMAGNIDLRMDEDGIVVNGHLLTRNDDAGIASDSDNKKPRTEKKRPKKRTPSPAAARARGAKGPEKAAPSKTQRDVSKMSWTVLAQQKRSVIRRAMAQEFAGIDDLRARYTLKRELIEELEDAVRRGKLKRTHATRLEGVIEGMVAARTTRSRAR